MISHRSALDAGLAARPLLDDVRRLAPWWQNLELPDGTQTAPDLPHGTQARDRWARLAGSLPADMTGWRALDVGCNAGFHTIELARRGALVTALDTDGHCLTQARWASRAWGLAPRIEVRRGSVYDLAHEPEQYDLVCCVGVVDGLRYPQLALDILRRITRRTLLLGATDAQDLVEAAGFRIVDAPFDGGLLCEPDETEARWSSESRSRELLSVIGRRDVE